MDDSVHQTCLELLHQRGYEIISDDEEGIFGKNGNKDIFIFFICQKLNKSSLEEFIVKMREKDINHCIIIYKDGTTSDAKKTIQDLKDFTIELFLENELKFNITRHRLVPKHIPLTVKESKKFKEQFGIKFPEIKFTDPISRFYGFTRGLIIRIERGDGTLCYRIVK